MKDVLQTEGLEMWQSVYVATRVVFDCIRKCFLMKMIILEKKTTTRKRVNESFK